MGSASPTPKTTTSGTSTSTTNLSPEQRQLIDQAMPGLQSMGNIQLPTNTVAGFTPAQQQGQQMALDATGNQGNIVGSAGTGSQFLTSGAALHPGSNPALQETINAATLPIEQNLTENTLPAIREAATGAGQMGGSRGEIAEGLASRGASQAEGATAAGIANQGYQSGLSAMMSALNSAPTVAGAQTIPAATTEAVGAQQQQQQQAELSAEQQTALLQQLIPGMAGMEQAGVAAGLPGGGTTTTGSGTSIGTAAGGPTTMQLVGGISSLLAALKPNGWPTPAAPAAAPPAAG